MIAAFDHVCLTVTDTDRSIEFYKKCFGFEVARRDPVVSGPHVDDLNGIRDSAVYATFMTNGSLTLEFVQFQSPLPVTTAAMPMNAIGCPHLGFIVGSVKETHERLSALGVRFNSPPVFNPRRNAFSVMLTDPDGIMIELREGPAIPPR